MLGQDGAECGLRARLRLRLLVLGTREAGLEKGGGEVLLEECAD